MLMPSPLALKPRDRKPPELGPKVRLEAVRLVPTGDGPDPAVLMKAAGLSDWDKDGFKEHSIAASCMWLGACPVDATLEFELPEAVPLGAIEVWNYNLPWQTTNGLRKADVAVSGDGSKWETVAPGATFGEAEGRTDYDQPAVVKLNNVTARKVRFTNLQSFGGGKVGLSKVVFHQGAGPQSGPRRPEDAATGVALLKPVLEWVPGENATEHRVYFGTSADRLELLGTTGKAQLDAPALRPDTTCFWRVDEVQSGGKIITGRVARFDTARLVAWWKLDETGGTKAEDASGHQLAAMVQGKPRWTEGRNGGALEFDGKSTVIDCGVAPEFDFSDGITVSAWFKARKFDKSWQAIVTKGDTSWRLQRGANEPTVDFDINTGAGVETGLDNLVSVRSKRHVDDGQWHHVVAVCDGRRAALYLDGKLEASADAKPMALNNSPVMIGDNAMRRGRLFDGWIDDVRLYGYAVSVEQVQALYGGGQQQAAK
jgi:hypothetical protein